MKKRILQILFIAIFLTRRFLIWSLLGYAVFIGPILYVLIAG